MAEGSSTGGTSEQERVRTLTKSNTISDPARCTICDRRLDNPDDCLSLSCGGDCEGCMIEAEQGTLIPQGLSQDALMVWRDDWRKVSEAADWKAATRTISTAS
jgi:hypothetical protein